MLVNEAFALAHGFKPGDAVRAVINGRLQTLRFTGIVLSPEYIYQVRPSEIIPDDKRFGVFWMRDAELAAAYDISVIPHSGGGRDGVHFIMATTNSPWAELFMPAPGGPKEVYDRYEEDNMITRGPEGIYVRPSDAPGFGWDFVVS